MNEGVIAAFQKMVSLAWELTVVSCRIIGINSLRRVVAAISIPVRHHCVYWKFLPFRSVGFNSSQFKIKSYAADDTVAALHYCT